MCVVHMIQFIFMDNKFTWKYSILKLIITFSLGGKFRPSDTGALEGATVGSESCHQGSSPGLPQGAQLGLQVLTEGIDGWPLGLADWFLGKH
jgi:hypothetical protein